MHFTKSQTASALLMAGSALAEPLTTITPCANAPTSMWTPAPITVTSQHQEVSTCEPTSRCFRGSCVTKYPYNTWTYVNTVIPCAWNGTAASSTTVTKTDQPVTISKYATTMTSWATSSSTVVEGWGNSTSTVVKSTSTPVYSTIAKEFVLPYNKIGPLAIPGYGGCGLCKEECDTQKDGSREQPVKVTECRSGANGPRCMEYVETWISKPAPSTTKATAVPVSTSWVAPSAGTYTFTFPQWAPAQTYTAENKVWSAAPSPYYVYVTKYCPYAHQTLNFVTTVTKTVTYNMPNVISPATESSKVPMPTGKGGFPGFPKPAKGGNPEDSNAHGKGGWEDWGSPAPAATTDAAKWPAHETKADPTAPWNGEVTNTNAKWEDWESESATYTSGYTKSSSYSSSYTNTNGPIYGSTSSSSSSSSAAAASSSSSSSAAASSSSVSSSIAASSSFSVNPNLTGTTSSSSSSSAAASSSSSSSSVAASSSSVSSSIAASSSSSSSSAAASTTAGPILTGTSSLSSFSSSSSAASSSSSSSSVAASSSSVSSSIAASSSSSSSSVAASSSSSSSVDASSSSSSSSVAASSSSVSSSSSDAATSTITTAPVTTSASTTTSSALTTTTTPAQFEIFYIQLIRAGSKYRKRANLYVSFKNGDAYTTENIVEAAEFYFEGDSLKHGPNYVGVDTTSGFAILIESFTRPQSSTGWSRSGNVLIFAVAQNGFCRKDDASVFVQLTSSADNCVQFVLIIISTNNVPTTTTTATTATSTTTSSGTPDPSADINDTSLDGNTRKVRRGVAYGGLHGHMHKRH